jgi:hypothetical protein
MGDMLNYSICHPGLKKLRGMGKAGIKTWIQKDQQGIETMKEKNSADRCGFGKPQNSIFSI